MHYAGHDYNKPPMETDNQLSCRLLSREEAKTLQPAIKELGIVTFSQHLPAMTAENATIMLDRLNDDTTWDGLLSISKCLACMDGDKLVGMVHLIPHGNPWDIFKSEWSYLRMVGVDPAYQGRGIARKLTLMSIDVARQLGEKTIALHTSEMMDAARHLYESLGFSVLHEIPPRLGKKYWLYSLDLR